MIPPSVKKNFWTLSLSPLLSRRLNAFSANKRGAISLWIFLTLFIISLFSEFIANDRPIIIEYNNSIYLPMLFDYPETTFGGDFDISADYKDRFIQDQINAKGWMIWPLIPYSYQTINYKLASPAPAPPSSENWLGTDDQGRDVIARTMYGFRISVLFGLALTIMSSIIGIAAGAVQGYFGGVIDITFQRFIEIWSGLPSLYILIIVSSVITPNFYLLLFFLLLFSWTSLVAVVRAEFLRSRGLDYIVAARALGGTNFRIVVQHLLPNAMVASLTYIPFILNGSITTLTALDFLGFGLPPGYPSLGELLSQAKNNIQAPWLGITIFLVLSLVLSLLVFIGEAVRDAFDPRKRIA